MTSEPLAVDALAVDACAAMPAAVIPTAVAASYQRRARQLWSYGRRLGLDPETAEETMQDKACGLVQLGFDGIDPEGRDLLDGVRLEAHRGRAAPVEHMD